LIEKQIAENLDIHVDEITDKVVNEKLRIKRDFIESIEI